MGLDNFIEPEPQLPRKVNLIGSMFTAGDHMSFRGKAYFRGVQELTGLDLYEAEIASDTLEAAGEKITKWLGENPKAEEYVLKEETGYCDWNIPRQELEDLALLFTHAGRQSCVCKSWW